MKHGSVLAVHARPVPAEDAQDDDDVAVEVFLRRKKLSEAWSIMKSCDSDLWTDVCDLYAMIVAVEEDPAKFEGIEYVLSEVAEAKALMRNAELLAAVETIESYNQEEWKQGSSLQCVRRGSQLVVHDDEHHAETDPMEARLRHLEHAEAWQKMKTCDREKWAAACRYHEEQNKTKIAQAEKLDAACWVLQDFDSNSWTSERLGQKKYPKSMRHAALLTTHAPTARETESNDPVYETHRKRLLEAWQTMKEADPKDWTNACKEHERFVTSSITGPRVAARNGVGGRAA